MAKSSNHQDQDQDQDQALKLAIAVSLLRSKINQQQPPTSDSDALRGKLKAKERKKELQRLRKEFREEFKEARDAASYCESFPKSASCKCFFFDDLGKLGAERDGDDSNCRFDEILQRRFLRQVRFMESRRRRTSGSARKRRFLEVNNGDEWEQLRAAVDFLVELCDTTPLTDSKFKNWSHQAVDFILVTLKNLLPTEKNPELTEEIVNGLLACLIRRMSSPTADSDVPVYVQHLIRKLGSEPFIGQRALLFISQRISALAEQMISSDPFDEAFPTMHECLFFMIQLIEFLISDYLSSWSKDESFEFILFEEWATSVIHARKAVEVLESRNVLYVLYMDRVIGILAKLISQVSSLQNLNPALLNSLFG